HIEELRKPDRIFVGGAVRFRRGAPLRDPSLAVMDGEKAVGIALLNGKKHGSAPPAPLFTSAEKWPPAGRQRKFPRPAASWPARGRCRRRAWPSALAPPLAASLSGVRQPRAAWRKRHVPGTLPCPASS